MCLRHKERGIQYKYLIQKEDISRLGGNLASKRHNYKVEQILSKMYLRRYYPQGDRTFIVLRLWGQLIFISLINCGTTLVVSAGYRPPLVHASMSQVGRYPVKGPGGPLRCWPESGATLLNMMANTIYSSFCCFKRTFIGFLISFSHNSPPLPTDRIYEERQGSDPISRFASALSSTR